MPLAPFADTTAILVTRGDCDLGPILETLPYKRVAIWDNSQKPEDAKTFGRWLCAFENPSRYWYFQDDDLIFTRHAELHRAARQGLATLNMPSPWYEKVQASWETVGPLGMFGGGALVPSYLAQPAIDRYLSRQDDDDLWLELCDLAIGTFMPFRRVDLGFEILPNATADNRISHREDARVRRRRMQMRIQRIYRQERAERARGHR